MLCMFTVPKLVCFNTLFLYQKTLFYFILKLLKLVKQSFLLTNKRFFIFERFLLSHWSVIQKENVHIWKCMYICEDCLKRKIQSICSTSLVFRPEKQKLCKQDICQYCFFFYFDFLICNLVQNSREKRVFFWTQSHPIFPEMPQKPYFFCIGAIYSIFFKFGAQLPHTVPH